MTPERWARIKEIFGAALEKPEAERAAYLDEACGKDAALRQQVDRLLAEEDGSLDNPVAAILQRVPPRELSSGEMLGHYRVEVKLGQGGMGAVYKAYDTHLNRPVALKVLPPEHLADTGRKQRLVQEARAASTLNHPNIITVHDVTTGNGTDFIAMEYVEGKRLDQVIPRKGLRLDESVKYAVQIADALVAAHEAGIVHRDLKPGNVMVTEDGRVKVLDFGLAKRTPLTKEESTSLTVEGELVGTPSYMSPEQAQGKKVDARSDIFSFGVVLYEMVTGQRAFGRDTKISTLAAILKEEPRPASDIVKGLPKEVEGLIARCLRKDPERRIQHMDDVKVALEELKEGSSKSRRRWVWVAATLGILVIGAGVWLGVARRAPGAPPLTAVPLTAFPGQEAWPSLSPDGGQVAFAWRQEGREDFDIYLKVVGSEETLQLTDTPDQDISPAWSPDGRHIAFARRDLSGKLRIYLVSPLGGAERLLTEVEGRGYTFWRSIPSWTASMLSWSPGGDWLAYPGLAHPGIWLVSVATGEKRRLTSPPPPWLWDTSPAFSRDGQSVAFVRNKRYDSADIYLTSVAGGEPRGLTTDGGWINGLAWTGDGRQIVFSLCGRGLWRIPAAGGSPRRISEAFDDASSFAISQQGHRLAWTRQQADGADIWRVEATGSVGVQKPEARWIASTLIEHAPAFSPDGKRVAFISGRSGDLRLWLCDRDASNTFQLAPSIHAQHPAWSPDGGKIAFTGYETKPAPNWRIFVIPALGGAPRQLTADEADDSRPSWSRDGRWIYFTSYRTGRSEVWKVPAEGGTAAQLTKSGGYRPVASFDGKYVFYDKGEDVADAWKVPVGGGEEAQVLANLPSRWALTENGLYFFEQEQSGKLAGRWFLKSVDFATGRRKAVATLAGTPVVGHPPTVSPDGQTFLCTQWDIGQADLMLVENFR